MSGAQKSANQYNYQQFPQLLCMFFSCHFSQRLPFIRRMQLLGGLVQVGLCRGQLGLQLVLDGRQVVVDGLQVVDAAMRFLQVHFGLFAGTHRVVQCRLAFLQLGSQCRHFALSQCVLVQGLLQLALGVLQAGLKHFELLALLLDGLLGFDVGTVQVVWELDFVNYF